VSVALNQPEVQTLGRPYNLVTGQREANSAISASVFEIYFA